MFPKSEHLKQQEEENICQRLDRLPITMFGYRIHNPNGLKRKSYDIHPYTKQGTGISSTITYTDDKTGIIYVLLAKKKNKPNYEQIGGYTRGQGPEGSDINYDKRTEDERDQDEEEAIGNPSAINTPAETISSEPSTSYSLQQLKEFSHQGFLEQQNEKLGKKINPLRMKKFLTAAGINYSNDYNAWETALRETREETGLSLEDYKPRELYTSDDFGVTNEARLHTKVTHYLFHLGRLKEAPDTKAGSDIEQVLWASVHAINLEENQFKERPLRESYLFQTLPRAIRTVRELELAKASNGLFSKYKNIGETMGKDPYDFSAHEHHLRVLEKAKFLSEKMGGLILEFNSNNSSCGPNM